MRSLARIFGLGTDPYSKTAPTYTTTKTTYDPGSALLTKEAEYAKTSYEPQPVASEPIVSVSSFFTAPEVSYPTEPMIVPLFTEPVKLPVFPPEPEPQPIYTEPPKYTEQYAPPIYYPTPIMPAPVPEPAPPPAFPQVDPPLPPPPPIMQPVPVTAPIPEPMQPTAGAQVEMTQAMPSPAAGFVFTPNHKKWAIGIGLLLAVSGAAIAAKRRRR